MGTQRLGPKKVRRLSSLTGLDFVQVTTDGHARLVEGVTADHRHVILDGKTGEVRKVLSDDDDFAHFTICEQFDDGWQGRRWIHIHKAHLKAWVAWGMPDPCPGCKGSHRKEAGESRYLSTS